uniref:Reverse transcriptase domain-containing protein n=1 Tax=Photinus pyralis TaxID=7054 RepID=A0A1Y1KNM0_PHOPY
MISTINAPTRKGKLLDHVFTSVSLGKFKINVLQNCISDHSTVLIKSNIDAPNQSEKIRIRSYNENRRREFYSQLEIEDWDPVLRGSDVETAFNIFSKIVSHHFNNVFPYLYKNKNGNVPKGWVNEDVRTSSANLKSFYMLQSKYPELKPQYIEMKRKHMTLIKHVRRAYVQNTILNSDNMVKSAWSVIKGKHGSQTRNLKLKKGSVYIENPHDVAESFNNHFKTIPNETIAKITKHTNKTIKLNHNPKSLYLTPFCEPEMITLINKKIKNKRSAGPDELPCSLIKFVSKVIAKPITHIVNLSFATGEFPVALKLAKVIPVFKSGSAEDASNYRPIAITSVFSKILEYCYLDRLESFLKKCNVLSRNQFGFRPNTSTADAVQFFLDKILQSIEKKEASIGVFCDISKAFDCLNHNRLLAKLSSYGIRGIPLKWLNNFLCNRHQYVSLTHTSESTNNFINSNTVTLNVGTPQGTVLAPILFILYTNDLIQHAQENAVITLYADDTSIIVSDRDRNRIANKCNQTMRNISNWFSENFLYLNENKTKFLQFHNRHNTNIPSINICIDGNQVNKSDAVKFLGITLDEALSWKPHCQNLVLHLNRLCYQMRYLSNYLDLKQLKLFYHACVESRLRYGICFWGSSHAASQVFVIQKRIIRCMTGAHRTQSCRQLFHRLSILPLACVYMFEILKFIYQNKINLVKNSNIHHHQTRICEQYRIPFGRININKSNVYIVGVKILNKLPLDIKNAITFSIFKHKLKNYLLSRNFYEISEYLSN